MSDLILISNRDLTVEWWFENHTLKELQAIAKKWDIVQGGAKLEYAKRIKLGMRERGIVTFVVSSIGGETVTVSKTGRGDGA